MKDRNRITAIKTEAKILTKQYDQYSEWNLFGLGKPIRYLTKGKKSGKYVFKLKLWKRVKQIRYFQKLRKKKCQ